METTISSSCGSVVVKIVSRPTKVQFLQSACYPTQVKVAL